MKDSGNNLHVLVLEDSEDDARLAVLALERQGYTVEWRRADSEQGLQEAIDADSPQLVLADHAMPELDSRRALELLHEHDREIPYVLVSGTVGEEAAAELLRRGASDFVSKGNLERLGPAVQEALAEARVRAERGRANAALRDSERRYRSLVTATSEFIWWCRPDGRLYEIYPEWLEYTGFTREQALGWGSIDAIHPDDRDSYVNAFRDAVHRGEVFECSYRLRRHDGVFGWFADRVAPVRDDSGSIVEWVGASRDVTARKDAEEALRASEGRYRALFEEAPDAILVTVDDRITDCNARAPEMLRRRREELLGARIGTGAFSPPTQPDGADSAARLAEIKQAALAGETQRFEWEILRGDGDAATAEVVFDRLDHAQGVGLHVILRDVTEKKRAERGLAESEARYRNLFDNAPNGIFLMQNDTIVDCNARAAEILGHGRDYIIGRTPDLLSPEHQPDGHRSRDQVYTRSALAGAPQRFEWQLLRDDGTRVMTEVSLARMDEVAGANLHAIISDITERKRAEEALRRSEADYHALFEAIPDGVFLLRDDGSYVDCNARVEQIFGWSRDWLIGRTFADVSPGIQPDRQDSWKKGRALLEAAANGAVQYFEWQVMRVDGSPALLEVALGPLEQPGSATLFAVGRDVTEQRDLERREREHHAILQGISEGTTDAIWVKDLEGRYVHINEAGAGALGRSVGDVLGCMSADLFPPEQAARIAEVDREVLESGEVRWVDEQLMARDKEHLYSTTIGVCRDPEGELIGTFGIARDVTEKRRAEAEMRKLSRALEQSAAAIIITDAERVIEYVNPAFKRMTGYAASEVIGHTPAFLGSGAEDDAERERLHECIAAAREFHGTLVDRRRSGQLYYAQTSVAPVRDEHGHVTHFIDSHVDVTEQLQAEAEAARLAYYDPVTGLANRVLVVERLTELLEQAGRTGWTLEVAQLDIDGFGRINASWGHEGGDHVLRVVGRRLLEVQPRASIVGRVGNDNFVVVSRLAPEDEHGHNWADVLVHAVQWPIEYEGEEVAPSVSGGVAAAPLHADDAEQVLRCAETALHGAREMGIDGVLRYEATMSEQSRQMLATERALQIALDQQQFRMVYQPQVDLRTGRVIGAEALLRWHHPERGDVSPGEFMPMLERTGLILEVGEWIAREVCGQVAEWCRRWADMLPETLPRFAMNLSLRQFRRRDLGAILREAFDATGVEPHCLELELTESSLADDPQEAAGQLRRLRELGISVALDDFGKGYSSLAYLKQFPIDVVKIDRTFVQGVTQDPADAAVLRAVLAMTESRGMATIAEGVETEEQVRFLLAEGCCYAQGFYFSRPVEAHELEKMIDEGLVFEVPGP